MEIPFSSRVAVGADTLVNRLGDESVLLNLKSESYYGLNESGTRMWQLLVESASVGDAYAALLGEFDVEPDVLERDIRSFVASLVEQHLVEIRD